MRVNVDKVLERDQKLSELDDRADALQAGASQFETSAAKLKNKYWWKNAKVRTCRRAYANSKYECIKVALNCPVYRRMKNTKRKAGGMCGQSQLSMLCSQASISLCNWLFCGRSSTYTVYILMGLHNGMSP